MVVFYESQEKNKIILSAGILLREIREKRLVLSPTPQIVRKKTISHLLQGARLRINSFPVNSKNFIYYRKVINYKIVYGLRYGSKSR